MGFKNKVFNWQSITLVFLLVSLACVPVSFASAPAGYSEYYIPGPEGSMFFIFDTLDTVAIPSSNMHATISVTAWTENTTLYYDHWENGYNFDPANPAATADETWTLPTAGSQQTFDSPSIPLPTSPVGSCSPAGTCYYDGGDRLYVAGGPVTVTRTSYVNVTGVANQGVAWEIYPVSPQLTTYVIPFGENFGVTYADFNRVFALVQATADNTVVTVDRTGDGVADMLDLNRDGTCGNPGDATGITLNRGQTFLLDNVSNCGTLNTGVVIKGTETLQVKYVTGAPDNLPWIARGLSAFPRGFWTKDYYAPLGDPASTENTDYYLYNPNSSAITVTWESLSASGSFNIPANSAVSFRTASGTNVPVGSGLYFKGTDIFWGVGSNNAAGVETGYREWGYSLLPTTMLYDEHYLGWAPDGLPIAAGNNDNGVFLTVAQDNTRVFVDVNNDGIADQTYTLNRLQSQYITDPDGDLSGTHFWATGDFSMVYGQNSDLSPTQTPALDIGYVALPGSDYISLVLSVKKTANPEVVGTGANQPVEFTLKVDSHKYTVDGIKVLDILPVGWTYQAGSTTITLPNKTSVTTAPTVTAAGAALPAPFSGNCPAGGGPCLTWDNTVLGNMAENQEITIVYTALTPGAGLPTGTLSQNRVQAIGARTFGTPSQTQTFTATDFVYVVAGSLTITKTSSATNPLYPGDQFTYTVTVTNPSASTITGVSVSDSLPAGLTYVGPLSVSRSTVADRFGNVLYSNNDGTASWLVNWAETVEATNPAAGDIIIANGVLQLDNSNSNEPTISRRANLTGATSATLNFDYRTDVGVDAGDTIYIEASTADAGPFTIIGTFTGITGATAGSFSASLNAYISANTTVRFRFLNNNYNGANEYFYVDNLVITYDVPVVNAALFPPDLINVYSLLAGQNLVLSFPVRVDNPLASGIEQITNTASATTSQLPIAMTASVTNTVVNPSSQSAEVVSYVWLDADGDGIKDVGEPGLANVEVTLKDQFGTPIATAVTDGTGRYVFSDITPGNGYYVEVTPGTLPAGLLQSAPGGHSDNRTNAFNLTAGQSFNSADLGYRPPAGTATFGDLVWSDADGDGVRDPGEPGLAGITVQLWLDVNDNGIVEPGTDTPVTSVVTSPGGSYLFTGVAATGAEDYIVFVDTTQAALAGFTQTTTGRRARNVSAGTVLTNFDFGFQNLAGTYSIRDRVWNDANQDTQDDGEAGMAGVTVDLLDASRNVIAIATSDASGYFTFTGVIGGGADYTIMITDTGNVLTNYFPITNPAKAGEVAVNNLASNLDFTVEPTEPDFGYGLNRSISGTVFDDLNGNGSLNAGDFGMGGVTVRLYNDVNGNSLLDGPDTLQATLLTDSTGAYTFSGLANGNYIVSIPTPPAGYNYTTESPDNDPAAGSQRPAVIAGGGTVLGLNFGYQPITPRSVSGTIWDDKNGDGVVDAGEDFFQGVTVEVLDAGVVIATTSTDVNGNYTFSGLTTKTYTVRVTDANGVLAGYNAIYESDGTLNGSISVDLTGGDSTGVRFGYQQPGVTRVMLSDFRAFADSGRLRVQWTTSSEHDTAGFYLFRLDTKNGSYVRLNQALLPALLNAPQGGTYSVIDNSASLKQNLTYVLVEVEGRGRRNTYGPFSVVAGGGNVLEGPAASGPLVREFPVYKALKSDPAIVRKDIGRDGTVSITVKGERQAVDEVSGYVRTPRSISGLKQSRLKAGDEAKQNARFLKKMRKGVMIKVAVERDGLYYLSAKEIASLLGITEEKTRRLLEQEQLAISNQGMTVAYEPSDDYSGIFFYGEPAKSVYTHENVYWLYRGRGLRMHVLKGAGPSAIGPSTFTETVHAEQDRTFLNTAEMKDPEADYWFWSFLYVDPYYTGLASGTFTVQADGVADLSRAATLTARLKGFTDTAANPDHHIRISLNGTTVGEGWIEGLEATPIVVQFDQRLLLDGSNSITLEAISDPGVPYSAVFVDSFDLTYQRSFQTYGNSLAFTAETRQPLTLHGFTDPGMVVFDVTVPLKPVIEDAVNVIDEGDAYSVSFAPRAAGRRYLVTSPSAAIANAEAWSDTQSSLASGANAADYLVIAPHELAAAAQALVNYRKGQGYRTMIVDLEDIMDEFNFGISDPRAIRDFLSYAHRAWRVAPRYVLLVGEGTYDYKNNAGLGDNLMPTLIVSTEQGLFPSDSSLADVDGDHVPDMAIGRLPVLTAEELQIVLDKIVAYEKSAGSGIMMIADNADRDGNYPADSEALSLRVPARYSLIKRSLPSVTAGSIRSELQTGLRSGTFLVNYMGHGNPFTLADEGVLRLPDVALMTNANSLFVLTAMTCAAGDFALPGYDALAEALVLKKDGGAVAVLAASGLGLHALSRVLDEGIFSAVFTEKTATLGDALLEAYRYYHAMGLPADTLKIYNLLGDPALRMPVR